MAIFRFFENLLEPTAIPADTAPPSAFGAFYWHHARQIRRLIVALFAAGFVVAVLDTTIPVFFGRVVTLLSRPAALAHWALVWPQLLGMALVLLVARPMAMLLQNLITNQAIIPGFSNLIRWQSHWHVVRQSWSFFQNDFAGRIANRVMQTGPALRESVVATTNAVWYILVYGSGAIALLASNDMRLAVPVLLWFAGYAALLRLFVPRLRHRSQGMSAARSALIGRIVDSYTNISTVKLFARPRDEDAFVSEAVDDLTEAHQLQMRLMTLLGFGLNLLNATLVVGTGAVAIWLWSQGRIAIGAVAMTLPLTWHIANIAGWVAQNVTDDLREYRRRAGGHALDRGAPPDARPARRGAVAGRPRRRALRRCALWLRQRARRLARHRSRDHRPASASGWSARPGAGKSTLVNLLLRFYEIEGGHILIDGQDIARVTQESLRAQIAMVTQDTSLLHRSIRDNIRYGRPRASEWEVRRAAAQAQALGFIEGLEDWNGRRGFDAHVGERGVKLSGGQRQRVALARVDPQGRADPGARRGDLVARFGGRGGDPGAARKPDARAHGYRHRPSPVDDRPPRPPRRARRGADRRGGHACRAARRRWHLFAVVAAPVRGLSRRRRRAPPRRRRRIADIGGGGRERTRGRTDDARGVPPLGRRHRHAL